MTHQTQGQERALFWTEPFATGPEVCGGGTTSAGRPRSRNGHRFRTRPSRLGWSTDRIPNLSGNKIMQNKFNSGTQIDMTVDLEGCLVQVEASTAWFRRQVLPLS